MFFFCFILNNFKIRKYTFYLYKWIVQNFQVNFLQFFEIVPLSIYNIVLIFFVI